MPDETGRSRVGPQVRLIRFARIDVPSLSVTHSLSPNVNGRS
jgi:hypothetical protein